MSKQSEGMSAKDQKRGGGKWAFLVWAEEAFTYTTSFLTYPEYYLI